MVQVLGKCGEHPVSNQELRDLLKIKRPSATKLLKKLCGAGLVQRTDSHGDNVSVELTEHGKNVLADLELAVRSALDILHTLSTSEKRSNCPASIRLDELEAGVGTLISKLRGKPLRAPDAAKSELPPKRPPTGVPRHRRNLGANGQISLDQLFGAAANGS